MIFQIGLVLYWSHKLHLIILIKKKVASYNVGQGSEVAFGDIG